MNTPVPPDAFTIFSLRIPQIVPELVAECQGNQQAMNKRLAELWATLSSVKNPNLEQVLGSERRLWTNYQTLLSNSTAKAGDMIDSLNADSDEVLTDAQSGLFFFIYVCTNIFWWTQSQAIAGWESLPAAEKKIYEIRGKRWDRISKMCRVDPGDLPKVQNVEEFYSFLPGACVNRPVSASGAVNGHS
ncbi:hypothetical protein EST38_g12307 [Candolleomyces aberdarensis]|uniref:Uncharacterized protein n=1 Tax=Candolleomyces aberdarensis TaxID=2316362 RepID=A0A4Q2D3I1_9AGAR|nr:hypothetical protein EST38_g12307 [Candolleomyces aberdarensis]